MYDESVPSEERSEVRSHRDLPLWHDAVELSVQIYRATEALPKSETYGLTSQLRRAAVSVAANVAEGSARKTTPDLLHFLTIAKGSVRELDTLLEIVGRLGYNLDAISLQNQNATVSRQLSALIRTLRTRQSL